MVYDINGNPLVEEEVDKVIDCKIIAHRGYHATAKQNTIPAFEAAAENGFSWVEIDIRKTSDGVYVLSHDATVTMYNNGTSTSVTIGSANYSTIKNYTWDSAGQYKLATLEAVFNSLKTKNMWLICDRKSGTNAEIMDIASRCGVTDRVMLSYGSFSAAHSDASLLQKYDPVPIRCVPSDYSNYATLHGEIANPIYADINASTQAHYQQYLNTALSCGIPVIFSGCTTSNKNIWCAIASGVMENGDLNISWDDFFDALDNDYDVVATITASSASASVSVNGTATITASSDVSAQGGYVYGYMLNPAIATVTQTAFGSSASFTVKGVSAGSTTLRLFTGSGEVKDISVTVS